MWLWEHRPFTSAHETQRSIFVNFRVLRGEEKAWKMSMLLYECYKITEKDATSLLTELTSEKDSSGTRQSPCIWPILSTEYCLLCSRWRWCFGRQVMSNSCDPMDCSPPGSSVHGILQARILQWVAISFSVLFTYYVPNSRLQSQNTLHHHYHCHQEFVQYPLCTWPTSLIPVELTDWNWNKWSYKTWSTNLVLLLFFKLTFCSTK